MKFIQSSSLNKSAKTEEEKENYWFPTPEDPGDLHLHTPIHTHSLQELENLNPQDDPESRKQFLATGQTRR